MDALRHWGLILGVTNWEAQPVFFSHFVAGKQDMKLKPAEILNQTTNSHKPTQIFSQSACICGEVISPLPRWFFIDPEPWPISIQNNAISARFWCWIPASYFRVFHLARSSSEEPLSSGDRNSDWIRAGWAGKDARSMILSSKFAWFGNCPSPLLC